MRKTLAGLAIASLALTGCSAQIPSQASSEPGSNGQAEPESDSTGEDSGVAKIGQWATADDGVKFRVSKITKGRVSDIAAGGRPGNPAVIATVQITNGSKQRVDLTALNISARLGTEGREAEQVFQEGFDGTPSGSLAPGRTSTSKYMFDAKSSAELKHVAIEVAPGYEYQTFTFEGGL